MSYADGKNDLIEIADILNLYAGDLIEYIPKLMTRNLIDIKID